jgi:hypothetical protein
MRVEEQDDTWPATPRGSLPGMPIRSHATKTRPSVSCRVQQHCCSQGPQRGGDGHCSCRPHLGQRLRSARPVPRSAMLKHNCSTPPMARHRRCPWQCGLKTLCEWHAPDAEIIVAHRRGAPYSQYYYQTTTVPFAMEKCNTSSPAPRDTSPNTDATGVDIAPHSILRQLGHVDAYATPYK